MNAKKLPSGSWRVRVFSHFEYRDGRKVPKYRSFTSKDKTKAGKLDAERKAIEWSYRRDNAKRDMVIADAVKSYMEAKMGVLSPSSIRAYRSYAKNHLSDIEYMPLDALDLNKLQCWVSSLSYLSPKTVKEIVMLVTSACKVYTGESLNLTLPLPSPKELHTPTDAELKKLLKNVKGTDLEVAISLAAFCSLRRGEVCALTKKDFANGMITVNKTMVRDVTGDWIIKKPKTPGSVRKVPVPDGMRFAQVKMNPDALSKHFIQAVKKAGLPPFRFHDLRHYYASTAHYLGVPDAYIMASGGWVSDSVMKRVYREALEDKRKEENEKITNHYTEVFG